MGYDYQRKISLLKDQTDDEKAGRVRLSRAILGTTVSLIFVSYLLATLFGIEVTPPDNLSQDEAVRAEEMWQATLQQQFADRVYWLDHSPFSLTPKAADIYEQFGRWIVGSLNLMKKKEATAADLVDLGSIVGWIKHTITSLSLRLGFVLLAMWPLWVIAGLVGYIVLPQKLRRRGKTPDLLGICDRGMSPFYSGIHGPLRSNNSFSGSDLAVPNLAVPKLEKTPEAMKHPLVAMLRKFGALNQTNIDLVRVILAYRDYPSIVEDENSSEEEPDTGESPDRVSQTGYVTNGGGTIEQSSLICLEAVLSGHAALAAYSKSLEKEGVSSAQLNGQYGTHMARLAPFMQKASELSRLLVQTLTPNRAWAIGHLPAHLVATTYLSTEAGKILVYKREGKGFTRISRFPHLQARAVLQSLVSYVNEHNGDTRMVLRQAIICSRRHGDFGRAFLPERMPVESRALRDWLEVLYAEPKRRETQAQLVELDGHIEEISVNFRNGYARRIRQSIDLKQDAPLAVDPRSGRFWKGIVQKSVVLAPLLEVVTTALRGIDEGRIKRISQLLHLTRRYQMNISISARLPGFKRQATEAQGGASEFRPEIFGGESKTELRDRWMIVRRMLTKYNWLSTRVGDDGVPTDGVVHGIVVDDLQASPEAMALEALVPLRQRRFGEMLGRQWENSYFFDNPHPSNIQIFVEYDRYLDAVRRDVRRRPGSDEGSGGKTAASA